MQDTKSNEPQSPRGQAQGNEQVSPQDAIAPEEFETLNARLAEAEQTVADLRDTLLRERAEIENQRRRLQRDLDQARRFANERLLSDLLPVCDSLEHGLLAQTSDADSLREGMQLTLRSLQKVAESNGLKQLDPLHQPFDPELHQAMNMVESSEHAPDTVVAVMQKGYVLNDRLLRPALVAVAKAPDA